jgi:hypothetical protein
VGVFLAVFLTGMRILIFYSIKSQPSRGKKILAKMTMYAIYGLEIKPQSPMESLRGLNLGGRLEELLMGRLKYFSEYQAEAQEGLMQVRLCLLGIKWHNNRC